LRLLDYIQSLILKILLFNKIIYKKDKALQHLSQRAWKYLGSPYWTRSELLREILQLKILD